VHVDRGLAAAEDREPRGDTSRPNRSRLVTIAIWLLLAICVAAAFAAAFAWRSSVRADHRHQAEATTAAVAASMASALRRDTDFMASLRATVATRPRMTNSEFLRWIAEVGAQKRYPGGLGFVFTAYVPRRELAAYEKTVLADPPLAAAPTGRLTVLPAGRRSAYCLLRFAPPLPASRQLPLGLDYCAAAEVKGFTSVRPARALDSAARSGQLTVNPPDSVVDGVFFMLAPAYRGATAPTSVTQRRRALMGWVTGTFSGKAIVAAGGGVRPGMQVEILHRNPGAPPEVVARVGAAETGSAVRELQVDADGPWTVRVAGAPAVAGWSATTQFWFVLVAGLALGALMFTLTRVLARSRGNALAMVAAKTGELEHLALHDGLTDLPNRALILDRIEQALARARRQGSAIAVMFIDLDGFKRVNDTFGHAIGDELLRAVGSRLTGLLRESDTVGRLGGDEFIVVVEGDALDGGPEVVADRIRDVLAEPFVLGPTGDVTVVTHSSIGIASGFGATAEETLRAADVAMYEAKQRGKDRYVVFAPEMQAALEARVELEVDLRAAAETLDCFSLVYQPTFDLATSEIKGVEALLRWHHPRHGVVMPEEFIPVAESTGLIVPIGRWVLEEACREAGLWARRGHPLPIAVNVSGRQLDTGAEFVADVLGALDAGGLDPSRLVLEITETTLMRDIGASARHLEGLKALGVRIAIDDFGTGYSSMGSLQQLPIDALKIDRSFVSGLADGSDSGALIRTLVQLGKSLGIETLAEGIEDSAQLHELQREQCDSGQGYLLARPLTAEGLEQLLSAAPTPARRA